MKKYVPDRGHAVWINMNPQAGHEQCGRRPAVVLSPASYNHKVGFALLCPVTSKIKGYPFEVIIPSGLKLSGAILSDQIKSLDWKIRNTEFCERIPEAVLREVIKKFNTLLRFPGAGAK